MITVEHPTFALGEKVILSDRNEGTVLADDGIGTVRVKGPDRLPIRDGAFYVTGFSGGEHDADRANLILDNRKV